MVENVQEIPEKPQISRIELEENEPDAVEQIVLQLAPLVTAAEQSGQPFLAHLMRMAFAEALRLAGFNDAPVSVMDRAAGSD